jgi:hypothetical protein
VSAPSEDLVDVLLEETLKKLPETVFLNRPYPTKVQTGVYRFGTREVTFHTRAGKLFVFRVGGYISESDALEFVAREFAVPIDRLKAQGLDIQAASASAAPVKVPGSSSGSVGMRRPMEWDNTKLLIRLVRRGLRARDPIWRQGWESMGFRGPPRGAPKEVLQKFVELNMAHAVRQSWARDLVYFEDKKAELGESSDIDSDHQLVARPTGMTQQALEAHPNYKTRLCVNFPIGRCTRGATCAYAHGEVELRAGAGGTVAPAQPSQHQFYKTRLCQAFIEGRCTRGVACNYAHTEEERQAFAKQAVVKRDIRASEDVRLAAKAEIQSRARSRSRDRYRRS